MATDYRDAIWVPSPNFWSGRNGQALTGICLHGTAGGGTLEWFQNPQSDVSAHYVVDEDAGPSGDDLVTRLEGWG